MLLLLLLLPVLVVVIVVVVVAAAAMAAEEEVAVLVRLDLPCSSKDVRISRCKLSNPFSVCELMAAVV